MGKLLEGKKPIEDLDHENPAMTPVKFDRGVNPRLGRIC